MSTALDELLERIYSSSTNEAEKGSRFERLIVAYLQTAAEYADRFSEVRLWQDWEGRRGKADTGIDIVAKDAATGGWCAVQCKFYAPDHYLQKPDIDSFLAASGRQGFTSRLIVSTTAGVATPKRRWPASRWRPSGSAWPTCSPPTSTGTTSTSSAR